MRPNNSQCRPLLRGTLTAVGHTWYPCHDRPGYEHLQCTISVWCPHCRRHHTHGWNPANDGRVAEHRCAHCHDPASPFTDGYWISVWRKTDPEYAGHVTMPGRAIIRPASISQPAA